MQNWFKLLGTSVASIGVLAFVGSAIGAEATGRNAYSRVRMPSMPSMTINTTGNVSTNLQKPVVVPETPKPDNPKPDNPKPDNPKPDEPKPDEPTPDEPVKPTPPECPDGGVKNSTYTIEGCMTDILNCVNAGALAGGLNDMFNEDLRHSIMNGMGLCQVQVEKCVETVRKDCKNVYRSDADVWLDFNSRRVQPEYYNFILRKTGLTPNQAENTCRLLDKNTYGDSFTAVANSGRTTAEYNDTVGAYNKQQGNVLVKTNPQGVRVNDGNPGVDGGRGHYARWDASTGECYIRVAGYNKDEQIKNSWLFGAVGNDEPAQVWKKAGETFQCNKDLFGFSLMNKTNTAAVVGVGGGTVVGAGVGALTGHGAKPFDCANPEHRKLMFDQLRTDANLATLGEYMSAASRISSLDADINRFQCREIVELYDTYRLLRTAMASCDGGSSVVAEYEAALVCNGYDNLDECFAQFEFAMPCMGKGYTSAQQCLDQLASEFDAEIDDEAVAGCLFYPLNLAKIEGRGIYCAVSDGRCQTPNELKPEMDRLRGVFTSELVDLMQNGEASTIARNALIGAGVGAGTGALATAITAFVEKNNINCRVGDGLAQVAFGKAYSIGSLRDFYVKWNLKLPDTVSPTGQVTDCASWEQMCGMYNDMGLCKQAQFNYRAKVGGQLVPVPSACVVSGSTCIPNYAVAKSHGACE